jgi:hypothetical protein
VPREGHFFDFTGLAQRWITAPSSIVGMKAVKVSICEWRVARKRRMLSLLWSVEPRRVEIS